MAFLFAVIFSLLVLVMSLPAIKVYQLENYKIEKTLKKVFKFHFAFGDKNKLKFTARLKRFLFCKFLLSFLLFFIVFLLNIEVYIKVIVGVVGIVLNISIFILAHFVDLPIEEKVKNGYILKARKKLLNMRCKKIAITGSFGKTTTKNFLLQILSQKFNVCATPRSFNTPMGVCKTILENLSEADDFFVIEMGARQKGDIDFLCKMVGVDYGILTAIGNCHIETFKSLENVENTKFELCENVKDFVVINGKNESGLKLYNRCQKKKYLVCKENSFAFAEKIEIKDKKTQLLLNIDGKRIKTETNLLGKGSVDNIVTASALCYLLGVSLYDIDKGIRNLKPIPHRMELIVGSCVVIDDSYNSNFDGFSDALDVLNEFDGKKILVSPGMVELGKLQYELNFQIAKKVARVCDVVVVMNKINSQAFSDGLVSESFGGRVFYANTRSEQKEILKSIVGAGDVVLFENDLPDNYR